MTVVVAKYKVSLASPIIVKSKTAAPQTYRAAVDGFDVTLVVKPRQGESSRAKNERHWTRAGQHLEVIVAKRQAEQPPPEFVRTPDGKRDHTAAQEYAGKLGPTYNAIARIAVERLLFYVKYTLRQPRIDLTHEFVYGLHDADWTDGDGNIISRSGRVALAQGHPTLAFGSQKLEARHRAAIIGALSKPRVPLLHEEMLSDAQAAATHGNFRRAVLEMAVACEVFVKQMFFGTDGPASLVAQALEDRGKLNVRVLDLIELGGEAVAGKRFSSVEPDAFKDIDYLFRARNKVAHRGQAVFRDDKGNTRTVDRKLLEAWWKSVLTLFAWGKKL